MREVCSLVTRGRTTSGDGREWQSTDAGHRGGPVRSSDEGPVMGLERRGRAVHGQLEVNPVGARNVTHVTRPADTRGAVHRAGRAVRTVIASLIVRWGSGRSGAAWPSARCGRWAL